MDPSRARTRERGLAGPSADWLHRRPRDVDSRASWHLNHCWGSMQQRAAGPRHPARAGKPRGALGSPSLTPNPLCPWAPPPSAGCPARSPPRLYLGETLGSPRHPAKPAPLCPGLDRAPAGSPGGGGDHKAAPSPGLCPSTSSDGLRPLAGGCGLRPLAAPGAPPGHEGRGSHSPSSLLS